jgi:hypothetical protein
MAAGTEDDDDETVLCTISRAEWEHFYGTAFFNLIIHHWVESSVMDDAQYKEQVKMNKIKENNLTNRVASQSSSSRPLRPKRGRGRRWWGQRRKRTRAAKSGKNTVLHQVKSIWLAAATPIESWFKTPFVLQIVCNLSYTSIPVRFCSGKRRASKVARSRRKQILPPY